MTMGSGTIDERSSVLWALARFQFSFHLISLYNVVVSPYELILLATAIELHDSSMVRKFLRDQKFAIIYLYIFQVPYQDTFLNRM